MQLLLDADTDIGIERKMAVIEQETLSLQEKFSNSLIENISVDNPCIVEQNSLDNQVCKNNEDSKSNDSVDHSNDNVSNVEESIDNVANNESDQITLDINCEKFNSEGINFEEQHTEHINCEKHTTEEREVCFKTELNQNTVEETKVDIQKNEDKSAISNDKHDALIEEDENNSINSCENIQKNEDKSAIPNAKHDALIEKDENNSINSCENNKEEIEKVKPDFKVDISKEFDMTEENKINEPVQKEEELDNKGDSDIKVQEICKENDFIVTKEEDEISNIVENTLEHLEDKECTNNLLPSDSSNVKLENSDEVEENNIADDTICTKIELSIKENIDENMAPDKKTQLGEELCKEESTLKLRSNIEEEVIKPAIVSYNNIIETNEKTEVTVMDQLNKNKLEEDSAKSESDEFSETVKESTDVEPEMNMEVIELSGSDLSDTNVKLMDVDESVSSDKQEDLEIINEITKVQEIEGSEKIMETTDNTVTDNEIINVADEKDGQCVEITSKNKQKIFNIEKEGISQDSTVDKEKVKKSDQKSSVENEEKKLCFSEEVISTEINDKCDKNIQGERLNDNFETDRQPKTIEKRTLSHISKLSNTLDILSDDDDDVVMLSDDEISHKSSKIENLVESENIEKIPEESIEKCNSKLKDVETLDIIENKTDNTTEPQISDRNTFETDLPEQEQEENEVEKPIAKKPLLPTTFLKTCKKNLAEMTRDNLEEFCILKIVESVVDRSNLTEISSQLKKMASMIEDYKKKANTLLKQNRDLQVVLKSVQEEQKKCTNTPITPMKITRSVGMQVFLTEKPCGRKKPVAPNTFSNNQPNKIIKSQSNQVNSNAKSPKVQAVTNNNQTIPVPRLVPAVNTNSPIKVQPVAAPKPTTPNGVKNSPPVQKAEKRPHNKMQNNSVTVDLTDDEPPAKIMQRNATPPVRLVSQQSLLATQRPQFPNNMNNTPRKVFIPIGTAQTPVRPGQTIMLRSMGPQGPRMRPNLLPKPGPSNAIRARGAARHPAPLPDGMKQYQPPNWKELPPAPELKLSKVDNGIVISWKIQDYQEDRHEEIASYQLYAYQETSSPPSTNLWKKIGDVKALPLPMACTLTQFMAGYKYYFAVRAVDIRSRLGPFSVPGSILLLNKM